MTGQQIDRDRLRELAENATPGPWSYSGEILGLPCSTVFAGDPKRTHAAYVAAMGPHDGEFIAAARNALPALLDMLGQAEQRIRDLTQEVRDERAACLDQIEQVQARDARIKAVEDVLDRVRALLDRMEGGGYSTVTTTDLRRALDGEQ